MDINLNVESGPEDVFAKEIMVSRFLDRALQDSEALGKFASYVNVGRARVKSITRDQHSFEQLMRIFVNDVAVFKRARLGFIGIQNKLTCPFSARLNNPLFKPEENPAPAAAA